MSEEHSKEVAINISKYTVLWVVGAIILVIAGWFGYQALIAPFRDYKLTIVDAPKELFSGGIATFTWRADGPPTTIHYTTVRLGTTSNPGELEKDVRPEDTKYTEMVKDFANGDYTLPLQFIGNTQVGQPGTYYYRIYALINDKHYWGDEYSLQVKPASYSVTLVNVPNQTAAGAVTTFTWRVDGPPATINHTSVHFGRTSTPGSLDTNIAPSDTTYEDLIKDFDKGKYNIPLQFVGNTPIATPGSYFFRAHAVIDGKHFWTDERALEVTRPPTPTKRTARVQVTEEEIEVTPTPTTEEE